jgi:hypothetical protein
MILAKTFDAELCCTRRYYRRVHDPNMGESIYQEEHRLEHLSGEYDPSKHLDYHTLGLLVATLRAVLAIAKKCKEVRQPPRFFKKPPSNPLADLQPAPLPTLDQDREMVDGAYARGKEEISLMKKDSSGWDFNTLTE